MKQRHIFTALLVVAMLVSLIALNSCDVIGGIINPGTGDGGQTGGNENPGGDENPGGENEGETKHTVTYVGGEGATGEAPAAATGKAGTTIIIASNTFSREGYLFAGWSLGNETYQAGSIFEIPESDVVFTAVWEEAPEIINEISSVVLKDMLLTVSGTINATEAKLCVGVDPTNDTRKNFYQDITVGEDGSFTASLDLNTLKADEGWYNVHVLALDAEGQVINIMASLDKLSDGNGGTYAKDTVLNAENTTVQIRSWDGDAGFKSLSFEVDLDVLVGGKVSTSNVPFAMVEEDGKVYVTFNGEFNGNSQAKTIELLLTYADPSDYPTSVDSIVVGANQYEGDNVNAFSFKVSMTDSITNRGAWVRFVLKVTEGDTVSYYTIKPQVDSHNGDWNPLQDAIIVGGGKYEMAICWSSVFVQVVNP